ncbi:CRP-like cAMP-binding protein [Tardiphaga robiniae]|uniref:Crp/Fnr family transcriptional regulator n=1 Tax=Tardiphaga robiniae TaxID=943830 RepID=UPI002854A89F|nr:Crp/Fnr family transcriptional regulator [Tardiphaga robiniae]MDR6659055.1 CRP-like cAMP-binding protein [Tardiphaga robiniae]
MNHDDLVEVRRLPCAVRELDGNEDFVRQGDRPKESAIVVEGMLARYHVLPDGARQYLSFHLPGDMPDSQCLFIDEMDHAVCAIGASKAATVPHGDLLALFERRPHVGAAIWRQTLIDAAIFRGAITNNSARSGPARMAHLFCELFYRSRASALAEEYSCAFPITLIQLGEALGLSLASTNRSLATLRENDLADLKSGSLIMRRWTALADYAGFSPHYLHLRRELFRR